MHHIYAQIHNQRNKKSIRNKTKEEGEEGNKQTKEWNHRSEGGGNKKNCFGSKRTEEKTI